MRRWKVRMVEPAITADPNTLATIRSVCDLIAAEIPRWRCRYLRSRANRPGWDVAAVGRPRWWEATT